MHRLPSASIHAQIFPTVAMKNAAKINQALRDVHLSILQTRMIDVTYEIARDISTAKKSNNKKRQSICK